MTRTVFILGWILCAPVLAQAQWVSKDWQDHNEELWKFTGVEMPRGMKFYSVTPAFQHVARGGSGQPTYLLCSANYPIMGNAPNVNLLSLWRSPGGLNASPKAQWRSAKAVFLPSKINVFRGSLTMPGAGELPVWRWTYPDGTIFADMLIRVQADVEFPFELRIREKANGKWDDGTAYRPFASVDDLPKGSRKATWVVKSDRDERLDLLGVQQLEATAWEIPAIDPVSVRGKFKPSRVVVTAKDGTGFAPHGYSGNMVSCNKCHQLAGKASAYASTFRGDDGVLSFHPFDDSSVSRNGIANQVYFNPEVSKDGPFGKAKSTPGSSTRSVIQ